MKKIIIILLVLFIQQAFSQKTLDLTYYSLFGKEKTFQFFNNNPFSYRLKGKLFYHTHKITNMQDSFLVFDNDQIIKLSQIKSVRIKGARISQWFFRAGTLFFVLDAANNLINSNSPIINERAAIISGGLLAAGFIISYLENKHIRITKKCIFRIIPSDYQSLNTK